MSHCCRVSDKSQVTCSVIVAIEHVYLFYCIWSTSQALNHTQIVSVLYVCFVCVFAYFRVSLWKYSLRYFSTSSSVCLRYFNVSSSVCPIFLYTVLNDCSPGLSFLSFSFWTISQYHCIISWQYHNNCRFVKTFNSQS